jgi:hypothetical protein
MNSAIYPWAGSALLISLATTALADGFHVPYVRGLAIVSMLLGILLLFPGLPRAGKVFASMALVLAIVTWFVSSDPGPIIMTALSRGTAFAGLMTSLAFLREGASNSSLVRSCGTHMIAQPPKLRYAVMAVGAHLFGLILNLGALAMLATMIMRGHAGTADARLTELRRRRALTATLRGFGTCSTWSPMAVTPTVVLSTLPMLKWADILPYSLALMAMFLAIGWVFDNFETRHLVQQLRGVPREPSPSGGWSRQLALVALVGVILACVIGAEWALHASVTSAVMIATPPVGIVWMAFQGRRRPGSALVWRRLSRLALFRLPQESLETVMFASSGMIGIMLASIIEPAWIVDLTRHIPAPLVPVLVFWAVIAGGQMGISPVISVVVIGGALGQPGVLPVSPLALAAALTAGWSLTVAWSPFTGSVLSVARISGMTPRTIGRGWNGPYSLASACAASLFVAAIAMLKDA